ncbi:hypothetical protein EDEG_03011 [Edhazardia aedis USNM 41457]|uniref:Gamma tubulin complex component C-terminal domain-containing protein n=1 Tax=Edhazardia aedis (strain USNM 41457) TaxID=1003232 RepID=J9D4Y8_EDHAE|nr:hypothetical protein EDEG_03011 [Edhazardia aedis USNM 41457]|eukprot:EJW02589.1 hypothetical protein EDEG_03011 [Edhazardia aedis USNM 41457]
MYILNYTNSYTLNLKMCLLDHDINQKLELIAAKVNSKIKDMLFRQENIVKHVQTAKELFLCTRSDFTTTLQYLLKEFLRSNNRSMMNRSMSYVLEKSLKDTFNVLDPFLKKIDICLMENEYDGVSLFCFLDFPLNLVFTKEIMLKFVACFRFIWRIKKLESLLLQMKNKFKVDDLYNKEHNLHKMCFCELIEFNNGNFVYNTNYNSSNTVFGMQSNVNQQDFGIIQSTGTSFIGLQNSNSNISNNNIGNQACDQSIIQRKSIDSGNNYHTNQVQQAALTKTQQIIIFEVQRRVKIIKYLNLILRLYHYIHIEVIEKEYSIETESASCIVTDIRKMLNNVLDNILEKIFQKHDHGKEEMDNILYAVERFCFALAKQNNIDDSYIITALDYFFQRFGLNIVGTSLYELKSFLKLN